MPQEGPDNTVPVHPAALDLSSRCYRGKTIERKNERASKEELRFEKDIHENHPSAISLYILDKIVRSAGPDP